MIMRAFGFTVLLFFGLLSALIGQNYNVELQLGRGPYLPHDREFGFSTDLAITDFEVGLYKRTFGEEPWNADFNYPELGLTFNNTHFGLKDTLGNAISGHLNIAFYLLKKNNHNFSVRIGSGIAYINKPYDRITNPNNNVIGSHFNLLASMRIIYRYKFSPFVEASAYIGFLHFSNGKYRSPNIGLNMASIGLGIKYSPTIWQREKIERSFNKEKHRLIFGEFQTGLAVEQNAKPNGPFYLTHFLAGRLGFQFGQYWFVALGLNVESRTSQIASHKHLTGIHDDSLGKYITMPFLSGELNIGAIGVDLWIGISKRIGQDEYSIFEKISFKYYLPIPEKYHLNPFLSLALKSNKEVAEYINLAIGLRY